MDDSQSASYRGNYGKDRDRSNSNLNSKKPISLVSQKLLSVFEGKNV